MESEQMVQVNTALVTSQSPWLDDEKPTFTVVSNHRKQGV
jgi:hypothetical protein